MEKSIDKSKQYNLNPRSITDTDLNRLENHLLKFGDLGGVVYCRNNKAYVGGNQRSKIFDGSQITILETFNTPRSDKTVAVGVITWNDRQYNYREVQFTEAEFKEACVIANSDGGTWDIDILKDNWLVEDLKDWGLKIDFELEDFETQIEEKEDNSYTKKIQSPVYETKNEKPPVADLYQIEKTNVLINKINNSDISNDVKVFLTKAAERHTIFNYEKIADFYAHSNDEIKKLMEESALVIIDFEQAIDLGYVRLSEEVKHQFLIDTEEEEDEED